MKNINRVVSCLVAIVLCVNLMVPAFALGKEEERQVSNEIVCAIEDVIGSIAFEKDKYGFLGVDLKKIQIGTMIPSYEVKDNTFVPLGGIEFYPIIDEFNTIVSMAAITKDQENGCRAYISSELVSKINKCRKVDENISLIFDALGVYCWDGSTANMLEQNNIPNGMSGRTELATVPSAEYEEILTEQVSAICELSIDTNVLIPYGYDDEAAYVNAPVKRQPTGSAWCWAACMASIVQLERGKSYTCESMAKLYTTDESEGASMDTIINRLKGTFNLTYKNCTNGDLVNILNTLGKGHVACGGFVYPGGAHVVIIRGIDFGGSVFSVMDPEERGSNYTSGQVLSYGNYGTLTYVNVRYGITLTLKEFAYM